VVDVVALRQQAVEFHGAHDGADIGHHHVDDRVFKIDHLVGCLGSIHDLVEGHAVHGHHGVVLGDDFLGRNLDDALHHVHLGADAVDEGNDQTQAGAEGADIATESFNRVVVALRHHADGPQKVKHNDGKDYQNKHARTFKHRQSPSVQPTTPK